jgi:hypothetical protein
MNEKPLIISKEQLRRDLNRSASLRISRRNVRKKKRPSLIGADMLTTAESRV